MTAEDAFRLLREGIDPFPDKKGLDWWNALLPLCGLAVIRVYNDGYYQPPADQADAPLIVEAPRE